MNHFIVMFLCFLSVEILIRSNYLYLVYSLIKASKKATYIIGNKNISDHWKENIIPAYSIQMFKYSMQMLLIIFFLMLIFVIADYLFVGLLSFLFSSIGIIECMFFGFTYVYLRKLIIR